MNQRGNIIDPSTLWMVLAVPGELATVNKGVQHVPKGVAELRICLSEDEALSVAKGYNEELTRIQKAIR